MKKIIFEQKAFNDFNNWALSDRKIYKKIVELIKNIDSTPFSGIGKPEPLKHNYSGYWSRRINDEHRLVYTSNEEEIIIISCKYHY